MRGILRPLFAAAQLLVFFGHHAHGQKEDEYFSDTTVSIETSVLSNAGGNGRVFLKLHGRKGGNTSDIGLPPDLISVVFGVFFPTNTFAPGSIQTFDLPEADLIGEIDYVEVLHYPAIYSWNDQWRPQLLTFDRKSEELTNAYIPIDRYLQPAKRYIYANFHTHLPQNDALLEQRKAELDVSRSKYELEYYKEGHPPRVKTSPFEQLYTNEHLLKMMGANFAMGALSNLKKFAPSRKWKSFKDMESLFGGGIRRPLYIDGYRDDKWFGQQRVQGGDPILIELINAIPQKLGVTPDLVEKSLEDYTLNQALAANKIFMTDLKIMDGMREKLNIQMTAPIALFYLNRNDVLMPIAIQLFQEKGDKNPVFTPHDDEHTWLLAKFYYNLAESAHHQAVAHLSHTHYLMEPIIVNTFRNLAPSHPVARLLSPHFIYTLPINRLAMKTFDDAPSVDSAMNVCSRGILYLVGLGYKQWNLSREGTIENLFIANRVTKDILPYYPYRDSITEVYKIIHTYVSKIINYYYASKVYKYRLAACVFFEEEVLQNDREIQNWHKSLAGSKKKGGLELKGIPSNERGGLDTTDQLIQIVTGIIFMASGWHATVNFLMYDTIAYPPNYPVWLQGEIPTDKRNRTEEEVLSYMPDKNVALSSILIGNSLASRYTNSLGDFEIPTMFHPVAQAALFDMKREIRELGQKIKKWNEDLAVPYPWGNPEIIPNAVSV